MQYPISGLDTDPQPLRPEYLQGRRYASLGDWDAALYCFKSATQAAPAGDAHANLYLSFLGLAEIQLNDLSGLNLCRRAAAAEQAHGAVFENLARAELRLGHRKQACAAIGRGLRVDDQHTGLRTLRLHMGVRRPPLLSFLPRDNPLNRILGKLTYRKTRRRQSGR